MTSVGKRAAPGVLLTTDIATARVAKTTDRIRLTSASAVLLADLFFLEA